MPSPIDLIPAACRILPAGRYAVGLSGGADSTALLLGLNRTPGLTLHGVHLDHQTRGLDSDGDADFVCHLTARLDIPCTVARRGDMEADMSGLPNNPSARYRALRLALFERVIRQHDLVGVILAQHGDDQAETVLFRLLRGSSLAGLIGMAPDTRVNEVRIFRPLLSLRKSDLEGFLIALDQPWREDVSNASPRYARNRLRILLKTHPALCDDLLNLSEAARVLQSWIGRVAPRFPNPFAAEQLCRLPSILARQSAQDWLTQHGMPAEKSTPQTIGRLLLMAADAASPSHQQFPGPLNVIRRQGQIAASMASISQA